MKISKKWLIIIGILLLLVIGGVAALYFSGYINADSKYGVINGNVSATTVNPDQGQTSKLSFNLRYRSYVQVYVRNTGGTVVKKIYNSGTVLSAGIYDSVKISSLVWNGKDDAGNAVDAGNYTIVFQATNPRYPSLKVSDLEPVTIQRSMEITSNVTISPSTFNPNNETLAIKLTVNKAGVYQLVAKNSSGSNVGIIRSEANFTTGTFDKTWDGKNTSGAIVSDGKYSIVFEQKQSDGSFKKSSSADVTVSATGTKPPEETPVSNFYGSGVKTTSLANLQIGHYRDTFVSYRFKAVKSGNISGVLVFIKNNIGGCTTEQYNNLTCYYHGNGGQIKLELKEDDGSSSHFPSGAALASSLLTNPMGSSWKTFQLDRQVSLTKDKIYHLVFNNTASDPVNNFVSINDLGNNSPTTPAQQTYADSDLAVLYKTGTGSWNFKNNHTPIYSLNYADGSHQGVGYIDVFSESGQMNVAGNSKVRETLTVSGGDRTISKANVWVKGSGSLKIRLEKSDGTLVAEGQTTGTSDKFSWATVTFSSPQTLTNETAYNLVISSTGSYTTYSMQKGNGEIGFGSETYFKDGYAQYTTGSSWQNAKGNTNNDLIFYLQ